MLFSYFAKKNVYHVKWKKFVYYIDGKVFSKIKNQIHEISNKSLFIERMIHLFVLSLRPVYVIYFLDQKREYFKLNEFFEAKFQDYSRFDSVK